MSDDGCKQVLPLGGDGGSTRFYCEKPAVYWCHRATDYRCLDHSHLDGCCERLDWPVSAEEIEPDLGSEEVTRC